MSGGPAAADGTAAQSRAELVVEAPAGCARVSTAVVGLGSALALVILSPAVVTADDRRVLTPGVGYGVSPLKGAGS